MTSRDFNGIERNYDMSKFDEFRKPGLLSWAEFLAWKCNTSKRRMLKMLKRCEIRRIEGISEKHCDFLVISPSIEQSFFFLSREVALFILEKGDLELLQKILQAIDSMISIPRCGVQLEEFCRWKAESELFAPPLSPRTFESEDDELEPE